MHAMNDGVVLLASDGTPELATATACALLGCADLEELRREWPQLASPLRHAVAQPAGTGHPSAVDLDVRDDGSPRRVHVEVLPEASPSGQRVALVSSAQTCHPSDDDLRVATQLRTFSRLSAAIAHDLKAPLAAVLLHLELLRGTLDAAEREGQTPRERQLRYVGVMKDELARLNRQLTSLFTHTAVLKEEPETFDLRDVVQELEFLVRPQAQRQTVALEITTGELPASVRGQRNALRQAVLNVAVNGLEAMPDGGKLQITLEKTDARATIAVRDTGSGIAPADLANVCEARYTTKPHGYGMGLYVTQSVLTDHGGRVRLESAEPGTRVLLDVPVAAGA